MIWDNKYLRNETKAFILKSAVRPVLTYAPETRADRTKTEKILRDFGIGCTKKKF